MQDVPSKSQVRGNLWVRGRRTRLPVDKGSTGWACELREVPPPSGAQMTRRMACTQSSISRWELAMSRSASGLAGTFSRSAAPPARQRDKALLTSGFQCSSALTSGSHPDSFHRRLLSGVSFLPCSPVGCFLMCLLVTISKQKSLKAPQDITRGTRRF